MYTALLNRDDLQNIKKKIIELLRVEQERGTDLSTPKVFPMNIWDKLGKEGLLGLNISHNYGGLGLDHLSVVVAGEELVKQGLNMGIALSWVVHLCASYFLIERHGNENIKTDILKKLASGEITISFAYGEMGSGQKPKNFLTSAFKHKTEYILNGKKDFLTNGPLASIFVVFARMEEQEALTAFLIAKGTPGFEDLEPIDVRFLNPSPHCSIELKDCKVLSSFVLGKEGLAYEDMIISWRGYEEIYLMGPFIGAMDRQLSLFRTCYRSQKLRSDIGTYLGELYSILMALRIIAYEAATLLDDNHDNMSLTSSTVSFGIFSHKFQETLREMIRVSRVEESYELKYLSGSIDNLLGIGKYLLNINQKKLGKRYLSKEI